MPSPTDPRQARPYMKAARSLPAAAALVAGLKPFSSVATTLMSMLSNPETPMHRIRSAIERDPAFASRLLHVANSAAYRPSRPCASIEEAVARLGSRNVFDIVVSVAALGTFSAVNRGGRRVRDHLVGVAAIARSLSVEWGSQMGSVFTCGLLHDIGKLLLIQVGEVDYESLPSALLERSDRCHLYELPLLGYDHTTLGSYVLEHWKLPDNVCNVVLFHHDPDQAYNLAPDLRLCIALVRIANRIEYAIRNSAEVNEEVVEELTKDPALEHARLTAPALRKLWPGFVTATADLHRAVNV